MSDDLACPRCASALVVYEGRDTWFGGCAGCAGVWLDNAGCQLLVTGGLSPAVRESIRKANGGEAEGQPGGGDYRSAAQVSDPSDALACPLGHASLQTYVTDEARQGVRVRLDVCPEHGTWFDRGEAWTLLQAVELKRLGLDIDLETASHERAWAARESKWSGFVAGAVASTLRRQ